MREQITTEHVQALPEKCIGTPLVRLAMRIHIDRGDEAPIWLPGMPAPDLHYPDFRQAIPAWAEPEQQAIELAANEVRKRAQALQKSASVIAEQASGVRDEFAFSAHEPPSDTVIAKKDIIGGLATAATPELLHALSWYTHALCQSQQALRQRVLEFSPLIHSDVRGLETTAYLPQGMADRLEYAIANIRAVHVMDAFESGELGCSGYYYVNENAMGIAGSYLNEAYEIVVHEGLHALAEADETGFIPVMTEDEELIWLDEAGVEHIAQTITWGRPGVVSPSNRPKPGTYKFERQLLAAMLHRSGKTPRQLAFAWSEPRDGAMSYRQQLAEAFEHHFGHLTLDKSCTFIEAVAAEYNAVQTTDQRQHVMLEWLARIRRPRPAGQCP